MSDIPPTVTAEMCAYPQGCDQPRMAGRLVCERHAARYDEAHTSVATDGFMREWERHENAPRTACPECHFELADCCESHRNNHAPGCSRREDDQ